MPSILQPFRRVTFLLLSTFLVLGGSFAALVAIAEPAGAVTSISPSTLPNGTLGNTYSQGLTASGGTGNITWVESTGTGQTGLPPGISFSTTGSGSSRAGLLSGTPTTAGTYTFTIAATSAGGGGQTFSMPYTLVITGNLAVTSPVTLPAGTKGSAYSQGLTASGGITPYTWSTTTTGVQTGLPAGVTLTGSTLSGTPTASGTFTFNIVVKDSSTPAESATQAESLTITPTLAITSPATLPTGTVGTGYSQGLTATGGTTPYTWSTTTTGVQTGLPGGVTLSGSTLSGTPTASGTFTFNIKVTDSATPTASVLQAESLTITPTLAITSPATLPTGTVGTGYSQGLTATGGTTPYTWSTTTTGSQTGLPTGVTLSGSTLSGTPTASGTFTFNIKVTDSATPTASVLQAESLTITPTLAITSPALLPAGTTGTGYSQGLTATGGLPPYTWSITTTGTENGLPPGVTLSGNTLSGTPTTLGTYTFNIVATNSGSSPASAPQAETLIVTSTPTGLNGVSTSANSITLSWNPVSNALRYNVYRSTSGAPGSYIFATATTSTTWTNIFSGTGGTTYFYEVATVVGATLDQTSAFSTPVSVTSLAVPPAPTGVTATTGSASQINVSWNSVTNATSYTVSRATTSGGPYTVLSRQPGTTYANNGLAPGTTYYYVVTATTSIGTSVNSTEASATTLAAPVAPVVTATVASTTSVSVAWSAVTATGSTGPTSYDVYSSTTPGGPYTLKAVLTTTSWANNGLTPGTTYYYVVKAVVPGVGTSPLSAEVSATPGAGTGESGGSGNL